MAPSPQPLGRVASRCTSAGHWLTLSRDSREASWKAQVLCTCVFVSPQVRWVHLCRCFGRGPRDPKQPRPRVWGRPVGCHSPLIPVPLLGSGPHTWGWGDHMPDDESGSLWSRWQSKVPRAPNWTSRPSQDSMAGSHRPAAATGGSPAPHSQGTARPSPHSAGAAAGSLRCRSLSRGPMRTMVTIVGACTAYRTCCWSPGRRSQH